MKTPEQIAEEIGDRIGEDDLPTIFTPDEEPIIAPDTSRWLIQDLIVAAVKEGIEADRAQRDPAADLGRATATLSELGYVWKVWTDEDVREEIIQQRPNVTRRELRTITEDVMHSGAFHDLADCTDQDWDRLADAVGGAIEDMEAAA